MAVLMLPYFDYFCGMKAFAYILLIATTGFGIFLVARSFFEDKSTPEAKFNRKVNFEIA